MPLMTLLPKSKKPLSCWKQWQEKKKKDNKEKEKAKGFSKALDRFKKRYKNSNSLELRTKKSEKINEIAKQLENIMGKHQSSEIVDYNNQADIKNESNIVEVLENQPITIKKSKKPQRPQI